MKPLIIKPDATDDIREAFDYYEGKRPGLGTEFVDALDYTLDMIKRFRSPMRRSARMRGAHL